MDIDNRISPTPYEDVNSFLQILLKNVQTVLGDYFTGMYLYGSLALGDFNLEQSDIDFLVVTGKELPDNLVSDLRNMHSELCENDLEWAARLEGAYIPLSSVRKYNPTNQPYPVVNISKIYNRNVFLVIPPESHWVINYHTLNTCGVEISGPPLKEIIDPVKPEAVKETAFEFLHDVWTPWMTDSTLFSEPSYQPFVVLVICRNVYTWKHGKAASKRVSAEWVRDFVDARWTGLINQAMVWRHGDTAGDIEETQEFIRYVLEEIAVGGK